MAFATHVKGALRIDRHVEWHVHVGHVLARREHSLVADHGDNLVGDLYVRCGDAWKNVVLHGSKRHRQRRALFEILQHQDSIYFSIRSLGFLDEDSIVACNEVWFILCDLVLELSEHDLLLVLELFLLLLSCHAVRSDGSFDLELDVRHHFAALGIVDSQPDHRFGVLVRSWCEKLTFHFCLALADEAHHSCDFALGLDRYRLDTRRVKLSDEQVLLLLDDELRLRSGTLAAALQAKHHSR